MCRFCVEREDIYKKKIKFQKTLLKICFQQNFEFEQFKSYNFSHTRFAAVQARDSKFLLPPPPLPLLPPLSHHRVPSIRTTTTFRLNS